MKTYIALLRGINVSGQKKILMADLKQLLLEAGLFNIQTYIQSGNVIFQSEKTDANALQQRIEEVIFKKYLFEVSTFIITPSLLKKVIEENPFLNDSEKNVERTYVTFLSETPSSVEKLKEKDYSPEQIVINKNIIYFFSPESYSKAKMNNNFFEKKLKLKATTRNWKTVNKLWSMCAEK